LAFATAELLQTLQNLPRPDSYLVAYSGGLDSHVLLHAMASLRDTLNRPLRAIHLHHGLQAQADQWQSHCEAVCNDLEVPLLSENLALQTVAGESVEALAREARYRAIAEKMQSNEMLLTAQHRDDQAETLLLQLLRGAGVDGLAGMPSCRPWQQGWLARPLLGHSREELRIYATDNGLSWVEDPSNEDQRFDRNYLRHSVMPLIQARWPSAGMTLARSAAHLASVSRELSDMAAQDLAACDMGHDCLSVSTLLRLPPARRLRTLREWVRRHAKPLPDQTRLVEIDRSVLQASAEASPKVVWPGAMVRRYRDQLWLLPEHENAAPSASIHWPDQDMLVLPGGSRLLRVPALQGLPASWWREHRVEVRWRSEDARCQPRGRKGTRSFKKLCQELGIPPWQRDHVPLVYKDEHLVAVADYCLCGEAETTDGPVFRLEWQSGSSETIAKDD